jgi:hypothetical protein
MGTGSRTEKVAKKGKGEGRNASWRDGEICIKEDSISHPQERNYGTIKYDATGPRCKTRQKYACHPKDTKEAHYHPKGRHQSNIITWLRLPNATGN